MSVEKLIKNYDINETAKQLEKNIRRDRGDKMLIYLIIVVSVLCYLSSGSEKTYQVAVPCLGACVVGYGIFVKPLPTDDLMRYYDSLELLRKKELCGLS